MTLTPTPEQAAIIAAARETSDNLLVSALAGAAKTSTLVMIANALKSTPALCLAFNKKIAVEMTERLPGNVQSMTLNSIGHRTWGNAIGKRLVVESRKSYNILREQVDALPRRDKEYGYEILSDMLKLVSQAKLAGYCPPKIAQGKSLVAEVEDLFDEEPSNLQIDLLNRTLSAAIAQSYNGAIDFDDQVYMPVVFGGSFPQFPLVMVDEAQDLSALNHAMLRRLARKRLIAVGDARQSIYGFRGAVSGGMAQLAQDFNMVELPLSVSFRCPREIVKFVRIHAPHMQWADWAADGKVEYSNEWAAEDIPPDAAIICRNNAPLFSCALALLKRGRGIKLVGSDLGPQLIKVLKKISQDTTMPRERVLTEIDKWEGERLRKAKPGGPTAAVQDKADCLRVFANFGETLGAAIAYAEKLFTENGTIQLMTGHKSKGLEFRVVYHLNSWLIPAKWAEGPEAQEQERNLSYVISTRAKETLRHVDLDQLV